MGWVRAAGIAWMAALAGLALAAFSPETVSQPSPPPTTAPTTSTASPAPPRKPRIHSLVGEVVEVQPADQKLIVRETLRDGSPKTTTFSTTAKTQVVRGADPATLADVRANDHVTIKYREAADKSKEAVTIRITPSAKPKDSK